MNNNSSPLQPNPGSLPQPAVYAEADRRAEHAQQDTQDNSQAHVNNVPPGVTAQQNVPSVNSALPNAPAGQTNTLPNAEDTDDLSPQWLHITEGLMRQHSQDPRVLAREFEKLKAHYIASRYGKEVKQSSDEV